MKLSLKLWTVVLPLIFLWIAMVSLMGTRLGLIASALGIACTVIGVAAQMVNHYTGVEIERLYHEKLLPQPQLPALLSADQILLTMEQGDVIEESFADPAFRDASFVINNGSAEQEVPALRVVVPPTWATLSEERRMKIAERLDQACAAMALPDTGF